MADTEDSARETDQRIQYEQKIFISMKFDLNKEKK